MRGGLIGAVHRRIWTAGDGSRFEQKSLVCHINPQGFPGKEASLGSAGQQT